jgi:hypothetical protein
MNLRVTPKSLFPLLLALCPLLASAQPARTIGISLNQQFGKAEFSECRLDAGTYEGAGRASVRCVWNHTPPIVLMHERALTPAEATRLLMLVRESDLLSGGHIGTDSTGVDGIFETLKVTEARGTAVLVTSGNSTFTLGSRRNLLDLLQTLLDELIKSAKR